PRVRSLLRSVERHAARTGETAEPDAAARVRRTLRRGITPPPAAGFVAGGASSTEMKGTADSFSFVGDLPTGLGTTRRADVTLTLSQRRLVLRWTPHRHELSISPAPEPTETELVRSVDRLELSYWGSPSSDPAAGM